MSGGSMDYLYGKVKDAKVYMADDEMKMLIEDIAEVLHDCEWWHSGDYSEEDYRKSLRKFKDKWFKAKREERLEDIIYKRCEELKAELIEMI